MLGRGNRRPRHLSEHPPRRRAARAAFRQDHAALERMRILLDENAPSGLRRILTGHDVRTAPEMRWASYSNGQLLDEAEKAGFEALITGDQSVAFQQNLAGRNIAVIIFSTNAWPVIRA